jgi:hypothetical protein
MRWFFHNVDTVRVTSKSVANKKIIASREFNGKYLHSK